MSLFHNVFGASSKRMFAHESKQIPHLVDAYREYYARFNDKLKVFHTLKEQLVSIKSTLFDSRERKFTELSISKIARLQEHVESTLDLLTIELSRIRKLISTEEKLEKNERKYSAEFLTFIEQELSRKKEFEDQSYSAKYVELLSNLHSLLFHFKDNIYGLFHILAAQLDLLHDFEKLRIEVELEFKGLQKDPQASFKRLITTFRILELEILRFGKYCQEEAEIIAPGGFQLRQFMSDFSTLRTLGLVYSERSLTSYNLGMITTKFHRNFYGVKGIGLIHENGTVDLRFVKGKRERHAEVVQMLIEGLSGLKLADNIAVKAYLHSLPLGKITKIAGYELQLQFDAAKELKIVNIDYTSTILEVQIERQHLHERMLTISKQDFERLNYALLFSLNKDLVNRKIFEMNIEEKGSKISVLDKRVKNIVH